VTNLCIVYDLHVAANNMKQLSVAIKTQEWVPIALLSTNKLFRTAFNSLNILRSSCQFLDIFVNCNKIWIFSAYFHRSSQYKNFTNIVSVGAALLSVNTQKTNRKTDGGRRDVTKLIGASLAHAHTHTHAHTHLFNTSSEFYSSVFSLMLSLNIPVAPFRFRDVFWLVLFHCGTNGKHVLIPDVKCFNS